MFILAPLIAFAAAWAYAGGTNHLALIPWRISAQAHWTERARILFPIRKAAALNVWLLPVNCTLAGWICLPDETLMLWAVFVAAFIGAILGSYPFDHELFPSFTFRGWLRYVTGMLLLRIGLWGVWIVCIATMPNTFDWATFAIGAGAFVFLLCLHFGGWLWLLQKTRLLIPPPGRLTTIVDQVSAQMGVKYRSLWLLLCPVGYAAALPVTRDLIFSDGLVAAHPDEEIASICAHELAHLSESRWTLWLRIACSLWLMPLVFVRPVAHEFHSPVVLILPLATVLLMALSKRLGRKMEIRADAAARDNQPADGVYVCALERLYQTNHMPAVMRKKRMIHPHLYDRLLAAGVTPAYPRPAAPPTGFSWHGLLMWLLLVLLAICATMASNQSPRPHP